MVGMKDRRTWRSMLVAAALAAAYVALFPWLYTTGGVAAGVGTFAPAMALAWSLGPWRAALAAAVLSVPLNVLAYGRAGIGFADEPIRSGLIPGTIAWAGVTYAVARARQLARDHSRQAGELQRSGAALRAERDRYETLLEAQSALGEAVAVGRGQRLEWANDALLAAVGHSLEGLRALPSVFDLVALEDVATLRTALAEPGTRRHIIRVIHADGSTFPIEIAIRRVRTESGGRGFVLVARDVTERLSEERALRQRADEDMLTGLANRGYIERRLAELLSSGLEPAVLMIDLDGFKRVNDEHGHAAGDAMLRVVARKILGQLRDGDIAGRLGGDEFVILAPGSDAAGAAAIADRLRVAIGRPARVGDADCVVGASVGIATPPADGTSVAALLAAADRAMYEEKRTHSAA